MTSLGSGREITKFIPVKYNPYIIGITGGSGSGKTSFIKALRKKYAPEALCIISQDDYYHPLDKQKVDPKGVVNYDLPASINAKKLTAIVKELMKGKSVEIEEYSFNNKKHKPKRILYLPAPVIIIEGLFVFYDKKINQLMNLKIFIEAKENLKVIRRIKRDQIERNLPLDTVLYQYENHVLPAFEKYILPFKDDVDFIINNNANFDQALQVISGFIDTKINH